MALKRQLLLVTALCSWQGIAAWHTPESYSSLAASLSTNTNTNTHSLLLDLRGGSSSSPPPSNKKKKKRKKKTTGKAKKVIDEAMKEKDAAEALGDAIRDRADTLREEDPLLQSIDWSISSLGRALGASDRRMMTMMNDDGGGVEAAQSSVLAHYFLKSHGGAHALQCLTSLLATLSGVAAITLFGGKPMGLTLLQRTMMFAMIKHVSGLLASAFVAAKAIPKIGLSQARQWMEQIALDPVSQYVFYTALVLLWLPSKSRLDACWWYKRAWIPPILVGPILVREIISNMLVISDVLVLWSVGGDAQGIESILKISQSAINAIMSVLVSPTVWRNADPAERQDILAKLVSRGSLVFEVLVGVLFLVDLAIVFVQTAFSSGANRPPFRESLVRLLCVRLYLHFLWVRRKKIVNVAVQLRGGATKLPFWFLDLVYEPVKSMGLEGSPKKEDDPLVWSDYATIALGLDQ